MTHKPYKPITIEIGTNDLLSMMDRSAERLEQDNWHDDAFIMRCALNVLRKLSNPPTVADPRQWSKEELEKIREAAMKPGILIKEATENFHTSSPPDYLREKIIKSHQLFCSLPDVQRPPSTWMDTGLRQETIDLIYSLNDRQNDVVDPTKLGEAVEMVIEAIHTAGFDIVKKRGREPFTYHGKAIIE